MEKKAREAGAKSQKGMATEEYWEAIIINRGKAAAKWPEAAVEVSVNEVWFNREIKRRIKNGETIYPHSFEGLEVIRKTRVRMR